ncbi:MAG: J domain-containing protein, partial [Fuerstiella sp.]
MPSTNYYEILEVSPDASSEVIRAAYRSLSGKYHPDKDTSPEGRQKFQQIQEANEVLSDPVRRQEYDQTRGNGGHRPPVANTVVMRTDGSSSFLTLAEHLKRKGTELKNCDLTGLDLSDVSFRGANLHRAKLDGSQFANCDFSNADLTECSARNCNFDGTQFSGAQLVKT